MSRKESLRRPPDAENRRSASGAPPVFPDTDPLCTVTGPAENQMILPAVSYQSSHSPAVIRAME